MKIKLLFTALFVSAIPCGCQNGSRNIEKAWDSGVIEEFIHEGTFVGYVRVYTIDWIEDTKSRSSEKYKVYKKSDGTYTIDYNGNQYVIYEADEPYGSGTYALKYQFDCNHYIEDIPSSY